MGADGVGCCSLANPGVVVVEEEVMGACILVGVDCCGASGDGFHCCMDFCKSLRMSAEWSLCCNWCSCCSTLARRSCSSDRCSRKSASHCGHTCVSRMTPGCFWQTKPGPSSRGTTAVAPVMWVTHESTVKASLSPRRWPFIHCPL